MRILIVAPAWVGDMVMAHSLIRLLCERHPGCEIELLAPVSTAVLGTRMPGVRAIHELRVAHGEFGFGKRLAMANRLRQRDFDQAIVLPNTWKSALTVALAGMPVRTGFRGEMRFFLLDDIRLLDEKRMPRMVDRFCSLALRAHADLPDPLPSPRLLADADNTPELIDRLQIGPAGRVLALCPGAEFGEAKRWPAEHFATLARDRCEAGWQVWLLGGPGDVDVAGRIAEAAGRPDGLHDLSGRTSLPDAVDLLARADAVVTNDSGLMHVACAVDTPTVAIYGSTSPDFTPPLGSRARSVFLDLACRPCFQRECPLGHLDCLRRLDAATVDAALVDLVGA